MDDGTATVTLTNGQDVMQIVMDNFDNLEEIQGSVNFLMAALVALEMHGVEDYSLMGMIAQGKPMVNTIVDRMQEMSDDSEDEE